MGRMKPIRFGYKVWCLNSDDDYLVTFDLYEGRTYEGNEVNEKVFGKCAATVLKNNDSLLEDKRSLLYNIYFDNLFTSFQLLTELKDRNYGATGTIRANRCKHYPLKSVDSMKKQERNGRVRYRQGQRWADLAERESSCWALVCVQELLKPKFSPLDFYLVDNSADALKPTPKLAYLRPRISRK
ncbi:piggyBac transposable element-derived protein 1-like [Palaemon carinicauda]|uniref:piggyBac transposable element-derived protein 1-like n=1 Tax=Palaemon carinicauda TaxID=392227 RepID=UPI0035B6A6F3